MKKLFYIDTHILDFTATVTECLPDKEPGICLLVLDQTAFFPEEGGQAADKGTIDGYEVLDVQIKKGLLYHRIANASFTIGQTVTGHVDWQQRFDFMQQHSGEHIISGLLHSHYGFNNVGFHLGTSEVTLDFNQSISMEQLRKIETEANHIVWQNLPVKATFPSKEILETLEYRSKIEILEDLRIVEIPGVDICACCAPHVAQTGEIGMIKITNVQSHRGGMRINILCGGRALADYTAKQESASAISALLSAKQDRLVEGVRKLQEDILLLKQKTNLLSQQLLQGKLASLPAPADQPNPLLFIELDNTVAIRNAVNDLCQKYDGYCAIFNGSDETGYQFIIGSSSKDCRELANKMRAILGAKGGGTAPMIQGSTTSKRLNLEVFWAQL